MMKGYVQISTATNSKSKAESIARSLVAKGLAACVQVSGPITSVYRWNGKVETAKEWLCVIKSRREQFVQVQKEIKRMHSYELPEITVAKISGSKEYLSWIDKNTS
jgi:periplasmic divalent cation tolerance protein